MHSTRSTVCILGQVKYELVLCIRSSMDTSAHIYRNQERKQRHPDKIENGSFQNGITAHSHSPFSKNETERLRNNACSIRFR